MSTVRRLIVVIIGIILASDDALAQTREADASAWSFSASAYTFILPEGRSYVQPIVAADRGRLHLEARENAEALDTGSEWFGVNFSGGKTLAWEATPILGGVFGRTTGVGLGLEAAVSWRKLELSIESEHVVDTGDLAASFFYNWSELTVTPATWLRVGLATQRTHVHRSSQLIQPGAMAGLCFKHVNLTSYAFGPKGSARQVVFAAELTF
ncbi:MAG TPA: hypothetical protein VEZ51_03030 [Gemmatimonadaceae bacterium]|nr:hypothetical protein [Gemmatimonadaceae bacterium]